MAAARAEPLRRYAADVFARISTVLPEDPLGNITVAGLDHCLQPTVPGFEYPRRDVPDSLRISGALPAAGNGGVHTDRRLAGLSSTGPVAHQLRKLEECGLIRRAGRRWRSVRLVL
ncbi:hypothetical protein [Streptomyces pinistramenti]|uniref:hypothetical protein n=1 Tax=Streptomyces pinistramenti TaxID=2884812 RepID=UPI001D06F9B7|nr:hypothetical protein [Streptomyces pinistramenti]